MTLGGGIMKRILTGIALFLICLLLLTGCWPGSFSGVSSTPQKAVQIHGEWSAKVKSVWMH